MLVPPSTDRRRIICACITTSSSSAAMLRPRLRPIAFASVVAISSSGMEARRRAKGRPKRAASTTPLPDSASKFCSGGSR